MAISRKSNYITHSALGSSRTKEPAQPVKIGLLSSGLGKINRGFEVTTSRWYESIKGDQDVSVKVYAGGAYPGAVRGWNLERDFLLNSPLKVFGKANERAFWEFCFIVEQVTFSMCLPDLLFWRPDVVWTKEIPLAHFLLAYKYMFGLRYKIIFANGGAFRPETYKLFDYIQHLHPDSFSEAEAIGIPASKMQVLPNCVWYEKPSHSRQELRAKYCFAQNDWIVICVAAWNSFQKRLDYLIEEVARIDDPNVKLLLCGQPELETAALKELAELKLGDRVRWMTLLPHEVYDVLAMSDVFTLPSFREGLASSIIEAAMAGLPIVSHPHSGGRFILQDDIWLNDMSPVGALTARLQEIKANGVPASKLADLQRSAELRFSRGALAHQFIDMVKRVHQI